MFLDMICDTLSFLKALTDYSVWYQDKDSTAIQIWGRGTFIMCGTFIRYLRVAIHNSYIELLSIFNQV